MGRAGCIAAVAGLLAGCLSSPPGGDAAADAGEAADAGPVLLEEMNVPGDCTVLTSEKILEEGVAYRLAVDGVISMGVDADADAENFWFRSAPEDILDNADGIEVGLAIDDLDIDDERTPDWGTYRSNHQYELEFIGLGAPINAQFHDSNCANNGGTLNLVLLGPPG